MNRGAVAPIGKYRRGVEAGEPRIDMARVRAHVEDVIAAIAPNDSADRFRALGVRVIAAEARFVDPRTVRARVLVDNPDGQLTAGAFGVGKIAVSARRSAITVPEEAIQWEGCSHIVFVCTEVKENDDKLKSNDKDKAGSFEFRVRKVIPGVRRNGFVEVLGINARFELDFFHLLGEDGFVLIDSAACWKIPTGTNGR